MPFFIYTRFLDVYERTFRPIKRIFDLYALIFFIDIKFKFETTFSINLSVRICHIYISLSGPVYKGSRPRTHWPIILDVGALRL